MFESIILGGVQGVTEWLPISSEGAIVLIKTNFFGGAAPSDIIRTALFMHLGTFLAALIYFRKDVKHLLVRFFGLFSTRHPGGVLTGADPETGKILRFIIIATLVSAGLGWLLLRILTEFESSVVLTSRYINLGVAILLAITGALQLQAKKNGHKSPSDLKSADGLLLGIAQGAAVLPGLSRSGLTVSALLLRNFQDTEALRLSFLLSLPIVLGGNILLNFNQAIFSVNNLIALFFSFVFGYLTIGLFLKLAEKVNCGWFAIIFSALVFLSLFL